MGRKVHGLESIFILLLRHVSVINIIVILQKKKKKKKKKKKNTSNKTDLEASGCLCYMYCRVLNKN